MRCWKCGNEIPDGTTICTYCSVIQDRKIPNTEEDKALRKIYDRFGCKAVFSNPSYFTNSIGDLLSDSSKLKNHLNIAINSGIGKMYISQLESVGKTNLTFL